jgi:hypothetical protein
MYFPFADSLVSFTILKAALTGLYKLKVGTTEDYIQKFRVPHQISFQSFFHTKVSCSTSNFISIILAFKMFSSPVTPPKMQSHTQRQGRVSKDEGELVSPFSKTPKRSDTFDEDSRTNYESSQEDNDDAPPSILSKDPFSSESSRILFESIGMQI